MPKNITVTIQEDYNDLLFKNHRLINIIFIQVKNSLSNSLLLFDLLDQWTRYRIFSME